MKFTLALGIGSLLFVLPLAAQEKTGAAASATTEVVATGVGVDADKALRNAFRNAVEQAVGLIVDAETVVKNEDVIKDQILTYSDGFVEKFDRVKEGKRDDGLYEVKIKAVVKRRQLIEKLKEAKISVAKVEGESLFAEVVTQLDAEKNAAKLLEKAFEGLPASLLVARVADQKPAILEKNDSGVKAVWNIEVGFDFKEYKDKVLPKLAQVLGDTALRKSAGDISDNVSEDDFHGYWLSRLATLSRKNAFWPDKEWNTGSHLQDSIPAWNSAAELCVLLNSGKSDSGDARRWRWFIADKATTAPVVNSLMARAPVLTVDLLGTDAQVIREDRIRFENAFETIPILFQVPPQYAGGSSWKNTSASAKLPWFCHSSYKAGPVVEIGPYVRINCQTAGIAPFYGQAVDYLYQVQLTLDEMKNIREIRCSIVNDESKR